MKKILGVLMLLSVFAACSSGEDKKPAALPKPTGKEQVATFAGGCFWSIQEGFSELKGVVKATSGYAGGKVANPTYEQVGSEQTGHAESVQVVYDPGVISFSQLLDAFFVMHDPTQLNRQGPDIGTSYRSIAFYNNEQEKKQIEAAIVKYNQLQFHPGEIVTEVKPFEAFYPAEKYHQNYVRLNPNQAYVASVCGPKVEKLRKALPNLIKDEFK